MDEGSEPSERCRVFVASGHGGDDDGRRVGGLVERELNEAVSSALVDRLRAHGLSVLTDLDHGNPTFPAEAELAHDLGGVAYYVAIHHNAHHTDARGCEAFGRPGPGSAFAASLLDELVPALRSIDPSLPDRGVRPDADTGAAKHLDAAPGCAAVVELCFLTAVEDRAILGHPSYIEIAAESLCRAIIDHGRVDRRWSATHDRGGPPLPPVVSVVIPTADRPDLLAEAVGSVLAQTVTGVEVLVVNDGASAAPRFADPRVRVLSTRGQSGPATARNVGMRSATGQVLAFLDDDDLWTPDRLDLALRGLRRAPVAVCATRHLGRRANPPRRLEGRVGDAVLHGTTPCLGATAVRREVAPAFDERWQAVEDVVWWWQLARQLPVTTVDDVGYLVRLHDGPRGVNTLRRRVDENIRLLRDEPVFRTDAAAAAHRWLRVGLLASRAGDHGTAVRAFAHHLWLRPRTSALGHLVVAVARRLDVRRVARRARYAASAADHGIAEHRDPPLRTTHLIMSDRARGAERVARFLVEALDAAGSANRVVALTRSRGRVGRVPVDAAFRDGRDRHLFRFQLVVLVHRLRREVGAHPPDVILAHGAAPALIATFASLLGPFPPFVWHRILTVPVRPWWNPKALAWSLIARRAHGVVAITDTTVDEVRRIGYRGPLWLVPNHRPAAPFADLDADAERRRLREELGIEADAPVVGFVGHLVPQKQPLLALEAFESIKRSVPDAHLVIAGNGSERHTLQQLAGRFGPSVHLLGHREDIPQILAGLDLLVATSSSDSMPGTVIEAQLAGCPVVAFEVDGIADALVPGCSGIVIGAGCVGEMAAASVELLKDPGRRASMSEAALAHAAGLTTERVARRYARLLRSVAGRPRPRVLHVLPDLGTGGAERALSVLARHLDPDSTDQLVVTLQGDRRPRSETVASELDALAVGRADLGLRHRPSRHPFASLVGAHRLRRVARRWDADVIDAALFDARLVSRLTPSRAARVSHLVNTPWDPIVGRTVHGVRWRRIVLRSLDRITSRRDHALVALSEAVADSALRHLGGAAADRLHVIPRGVDLEHYSAFDAPPRTDTLRLVSVGRLVPQKGHDTLVRAVAELAGRGITASLTIVGEGDERELLEELARHLGVAQAIHLAGAHRDVRPFLEAADLFVLASRWEGQSNAVLEAMASGRAIVAGDVPALREVVGDTGVLVAPDDPSGWADALAELAVDPDECDRLASAARRRVETTYAARSRSAELGVLYEGLVEQRRTRDRPGDVSRV